MRTVAVIAAGLLALTIHTGSAAACEDDDDPELCAEQLAEFDEAFDEQASMLDKVQLVVGDRILRALVVRYAEEDERLVEFEEETDFDDEQFDDSDDVDVDESDLDS